MNVPMPLVVVAITVLASVFSTAIWSFAKKTNTAIQKNTEAYNNLAIVLARIEEWRVSTSELSNAKHKVIDETLYKHESRLDYHEKEIIQLKTKRK